MAGHLGVQVCTQAKGPFVQGGPLTFGLRVPLVSGTCILSMCSSALPQNQDTGLSQ